MLGYGRRSIVAAVSAGSDINTVTDLRTRLDTVRIATEYPNLAQSFAASARLKRFYISPVWGGVEGYPPDDADVVILPANNEDEVISCGLKVINRLMESQAVVVANRNSLLGKDLAGVISAIPSQTAECAASPQNDSCNHLVTSVTAARSANCVRLALPDGHQQAHVKKILDRAGIEVNPYPSAEGNRRPESDVDNVAIKVIRPQDMPLQVANGQFDLAITGRDWLIDHLYRFPTSPLVELLDLKYGRVRIVAVVDNRIEHDNIPQLIRQRSERELPYRIATEYVNIADRYAQEKRLGRYCIIPTWGATEAFIPEDADMLIENTETGGTIARHNLKIIDTLFISTACLIGRRDFRKDRLKAPLIDHLISRLQSGVEE